MSSSPPRSRSSCWNGNAGANVCFAPSVIRADRGTNPRVLVGEEVTDETLMAAYIAGDRAAFDQLFARHAPALLGMMRRHVRSGDLANDLLQQTFLQLHRARFDFKQGALLRPWL